MSTASHAPAVEHSTPDGASSSLDDQIRALIAAGKCKQAVELAKDAHKRSHSAATERLLVDAYLARIAQFQEKGAAEDAQTLLKLVYERFPAHRPRLTALKAGAAAIAGNIESLLAPLARADLPPEQRSAIETAVRQHVIDLPAVANCRCLPDGHPLKTAAAALARALEAVTSGPVSDEQIALPEVPHRSPLAPWKLLIRGLAAFYQRNDEGCRQAMRMLPADCAAHPLAAVVESLLEGRPPAKGMAAVLYERVCGDPSALRSALQRVEDAIWTEDVGGAIVSMRHAAQLCAQYCPQLLDELRRLLAVKFACANMPLSELWAAVGGWRNDSRFWRLMAVAAEGAVSSALDWHMFVHHAIAEDLFRAGSVEEAVVRLAAAEALAQRSPADLARARRWFLENASFDPFYQGQPAEIARLKPPSLAAVLDCALDPSWLFARAAAIHPDPTVFEKWQSWLAKARAPACDMEAMAQTWRRLRPGDPRPLLALSSLAEQRKALARALKYLAEAEAIDALNPQVRKARLRLTVATAWRHLKDRRTHLLEQDLAQLQALPAIHDGHGAAFVDALRAALHALRNEPQPMQHCCDAVVQRIGPLAARVLFNCVRQTGRLQKHPHWPVIDDGPAPTPRQAAEAHACIVRLVDDLRLRMYLPSSWRPLIRQAIADTASPLAPADLLVIGHALALWHDYEAAYLASAAGLAAVSGPQAARFLILRAVAVRPCGAARSLQCLRAAAELAQQTHDQQLMDEVSAAFDRLGLAGRRLRGGRTAMKAELLAEVLKAERQATAPPRSRADAQRHLVLMESAPRTRQRSLFDPPEEDEQDAFEDDEELDGADAPEPPGATAPKDDSPELDRLLDEVARRFGSPPNVSRLFHEDPALALLLMAALQGLEIPPGQFERLRELLESAGLLDFPEPPRRR